LTYAIRVLADRTAHRDVNEARQLEAKAIGPRPRPRPESSRFEARAENEAQIG